MEQRRLRLGDILDDYCPRERRLTNHVVVAMIEEDVRQTRCTTCEAEHVYKKGKEPRRRSRKDSPEGLFREVLAGMPDADGVPAVLVPAGSEPSADDLRSEDEMEAMQMADGVPAAIEDLPAEREPEAVPDEAPPPADDGFFHRRLIRAQLPRTEGQKEVRQEPDFTIRSNTAGRGGHFRGSRAQGGAAGPNGNGHNHGGRPGPRRFGGGNPSGRGPSAGAGRGPSTGSGRGAGRPGFGGGQSRHGGSAPGASRGPSGAPGQGRRKRSR